MGDRPIVVVSNRGPVSFRRDDTGTPVPRRGAGGLVSGLTPLLRRPDRIWLAAALSDDDRAAVGTTGATHRVEVDGIGAVLVSVDPDDLHASYEVVCNETLWYVHHHLFDSARRPVFDTAWFAAWEAYERVNAVFADLVADTAPADAIVLVQDYHLYLVAAMLAGRRGDLDLVHFSHTPFADPHAFAVLPDRVRSGILRGLATYTACGFHTATWRDAFTACCRADGITPPRVFVAPLGPDAADLAATRSSTAFAEATAALDGRIGDRACIARSDRIELSKNLVRGFLAFDTLLADHSEWRDRVVFAASVYPSRGGNTDYVAYRAEVEACVDRVNERWGTSTWTPILLDTRDHFPTSVATLARADVVLVNPVRDGLNLVASEAMVVNERDALLALSPHAGAWSVLGGAAAAVHPHDVVATADVLHTLLSTDAATRAATAARLRAAAASRRPADWLADQVAAVA